MRQLKIGDRIQFNDTKDIFTVYFVQQDWENNLNKTSYGIYRGIKKQTPDSDIYPFMFHNFLTTRIKIITEEKTKDINKRLLKERYEDVKKG